jgi:hypothetical protein
MGARLQLRHRPRGQVASFCLIPKTMVLPFTANALARAVARGNGQRADRTAAAQDRAMDNTRKSRTATLWLQGVVVAAAAVPVVAPAAAAAQEQAIDRVQEIRAALLAAEPLDLRAPPVLKAQCDNWSNWNKVMTVQGNDAEHDSPWHLGPVAAECGARRGVSGSADLRQPALMGFSL